MDNTEILQKILDKTQNQSAVSDIKISGTQRYLIFSLEGKKYALQAEYAREILINTEIYFLPFVPAYISGLINRHGDPYTVIDLKVLLESTPQKSTRFLVLNVENDQIALLIEDIIDISEIDEKELFKLSSDDREGDFFKGSFNFKGDEVLILNIRNILEKLDHDLK